MKHPRLALGLSALVLMAAGVGVALLVDDAGDAPGRGARRARRSAAPDPTTTPDSAHARQLADKPEDDAPRSGPAPVAPPAPTTPTTADDDAPATPVYADPPDVGMTEEAYRKFLASVLAALKATAGDPPAKALRAIWDLMRAFGLSRDEQAHLIDRLFVDLFGREDLSWRDRLTIAELMRYRPGSVERWDRAQALIDQALIPALLELWQASDRAVPGAWFAGLAGLSRTKESTALLVRMYDTAADADLKRTIIDQLGRQRTTAASAELVRMLIADTDGANRDALYRALLDGATPETLAALRGKLSDPKASVKDKAIAFDILATTLRRLERQIEANGTPSQDDLARLEELRQNVAGAAGTLFTLYGDAKDYTTKRMVISALGELNTPESRGFLIDFMMREADPALLQAVAMNMRGSDELKRLLANPNAPLDARLAAWETAGGRDRRQGDAAAILESLLDAAFAPGTTGDQRARAARALGYTADPRVRDYLLDELRDSGADAGRLLDATGDLLRYFRREDAVSDELKARALPTLSEALRGDRLAEAEAIRALDTLVGIDRAAATPTFVDRARRSKSPRVRRRALGYLLYVPGDAHLPLFRELAEHDPNPEVRRLAERAIARRSDTSGR